MWFYLYDMSRISKFKNTESRLVGLGLGERKWDVIANGYRISSWGDENVLDLRGDGYTP